LKTGDVENHIAFFLVKNGNPIADICFYFNLRFFGVMNLMRSQGAQGECPPIFSIYSHFVL